MPVRALGGDEFNRWRKNLQKFAKQIEMLQRRLALQGEVNIRNAFFKRFNSVTGETVKIRSELIPDGVAFYSDTVYSQYLEEGVKRHVMRYLLKAKRPIPFKNGKKITFRRVTLKAIAAGKWVHKGIEKDQHVHDGMGFMEAGIDKTLRDANREIENLKKQIMS